MTMPNTPLLQALSSNPLAATALGMWTAAVLTFLLKDIPSRIYAFLLRQATTTLQVTTREEEFKALANWIEAQGFARGFRTLRVRGRILSAGFGRHYFFYEGTLCWFHRARVDNKELDLEEIYLSCLGRDQELLRRLMRDAVDSIERGDRTRIYGVKWRSWIQLAAQNKRRMDSLFLSDANMKAVASHLNRFFGAKDWYRRHGIPYRTGLCLSGPPGTGKTSLVRALCAEYGLGLYTFDLANSNDQEFKEMVCQLGPRSLLLLEDIDTVAAAWNRLAVKKAADAQESEGKLTLGGVLNAVDGVAESDGRVLVMTTNDAQKLDPALLRPGRVDLSLFLGPMEPSMFRRAFAAFYPQASVPEDFPWPAGLAPAEFQQMILRNTASPETVLAELRALEARGSGAHEHGPMARQ